jgi:hypothetical protein
MKVQRGDVVLTRVPHAAGGRGKKRPAVVVQADRYNRGRKEGRKGDAAQIIQKIKKV